MTANPPLHHASLQEEIPARDSLRRKDANHPPVEVPPHAVRPTELHPRHRLAFASRPSSRSTSTRSPTPMRFPTDSPPPPPCRPSSARSTAKNWRKATKRFASHLNVSKKQAQSRESRARAQINLTAARGLRLAQHPPARIRPSIRKHLIHRLHQSPPGYASICVTLTANSASETSSNPIARGFDFTRIRASEPRQLAGQPPPAVDILPAAAGDQRHVSHHVEAIEMQLHAKLGQRQMIAGPAGFRIESAGRFRQRPGAALPC